MAAQRIGIVWNPSKTTRDEVEAALRDASGTDQHDVVWFETREDDAGREATRDALAAHCDLVIAVGGDGTVRAVAEQLAETRAGIDLGIVPLGTGNLLARNLGIPLNDAGAAFERALTKAGSPIDIGWAEVQTPSGVERHAFAVMAGFGIDAHMITETNDGLKDKAGWLAYVESLGRALAASTVIDVRIAVDGGDAQAERAHTVIVGNCGMLQGGLTLLPDADPADGELDLLVLHAEGLGGWLDTLRTAGWENGIRRLFDRGGQSARSTDSTTHRRMTSVTIELDEPRDFEVDGDEVGRITNVAFSVQPAAVRVR
jgi:diacylglycerol kinase family enzyme